MSSLEIIRGVSGDPSSQNALFASSRPSQPFPCIAGVLLVAAIGPSTRTRGRLPSHPSVVWMGNLVPRALLLLNTMGNEDGTSLIPH